MTDVIEVAFSRLFTLLPSGGTISHQHGVGRDHAAYLQAEKGAVGMAALSAAFNHFDPRGVLANDNLTGPPH